MNKKLIICVVAESGSGKSLLADFLEKYAGIPKIKSYTTRPPREQEEEYNFITESEFSKLKPSEMIAPTNYGLYRYCALKKDLKQSNTYVIDEYGLKTLKSQHDNEFKILSVRIIRSKEQRIKAVGVERVLRDEGKFKFLLTDFDILILNRGQSKAAFVTEVYTSIITTLAQRGYVL